MSNWSVIGVAHEGWTKLWRSLMDNPLWTEEPFTKGQAWVDLIMMAKRPDSDDPGAVCCSVLYLANRWRWSHGKVRRFLERLKRCGMIIVHKNGHQNGQSNGKLLTVAKYSAYQTDGKQNGNPNGKPNGKENGKIEEDGKEAVRRPDGGGTVDRKLPAAFRDMGFESYEEYEEWRRRNT